MQKMKGMKNSEKRLFRDIISGFNRRRILVLGDLMVDKFVWGKVSRISPEAPVPVVEIAREDYMPGGSGNVANNIASLGAMPYLCGIIGRDIVGKKLIESLNENKIKTDSVLIDSSRPTILKTRIIAHNQQIVRFDREDRSVINSRFREKIKGLIRKIMNNVDGLIISDYGKGMIDGTLLKSIISSARKKAIPVTVDPKPENFSFYRHVSCITPNINEAAEAGRTSISNRDELIRTGKKLLQASGSHAILITQGEAGMTLIEKGQKPSHIPTSAQEVYDVTGAGDTVISVLTLALSCGADFLTAARLSNLAAGIVVGKLGTATVSCDELLDRIDNR